MSAAGLLLSLVLGALNLTEPPSDRTVLAEAVEAFQRARAIPEQPDQARKLYEQAAAGCEELRVRGAHNADLYRNQGNAYLLAGDLPRALLAYRRGIRLAPNDAALRASLDHAREQVMYPAHAALGRPPVDHWPPWLPRPSPSRCFWLAGLSYAAGCMAATRFWMVRQRVLLLLATGAWASCLLLVVIPLGERNTDQRSRLVIVAEDGVLLRKGNGLTYPPRYETPLNRGVEARLRFVRGEWLQVELAGGEVGWVPRELVVLDNP